MRAIYSFILIVGFVWHGTAWLSGSDAELELSLANRFAPVLFYDQDEPNMPTSVEQFFKNTELWFYSQYCQPQNVLVSRAGPSLPRRILPDCRNRQQVDSHGTRSAGKRATFYLANIDGAGRRGSLDSTQWITYFHAYPNNLGGITLQYWRLYPYNSGFWLGLRATTGDHGGDWEAIHVVLQRDFTPVQIRLLGHRQIVTRDWSDALVEGTHPLIACEKGSHTSQLMTRSDLPNRRGFIEQQSWTGGSVRWPDGRISRSGPLAKLGQRTKPMPGMEWLQYSGLWGTRESSGFLSFYRSGYWGPAFNETGMRQDGFIAAWCEGITLTGEDLKKECYPSQTIP